MLNPKSIKYKKHHRGRMKGKSTTNIKLKSGNFALQALEPSWITAKQIEATKRTILKQIKKTGKLWLKIFPDKPVTQRAKESRMGSGKGSVEYWVAVVKPFSVILEIYAQNETAGIAALKLASNKLPIKTKIIKGI